MAAAEKPQDLIERIRVNFELGGHKDTAIAMVRQKINIYLVSSLPPDTVRQGFLETFMGLKEAYTRAL